MKNFVALVLSAILIFGVNFFAAENRNKIVKVLIPEKTEIIHFTKNTEEGEEMIWSVMNSSEKKNFLRSSARRKEEIIRNISAKS